MTELSQRKKALCVFLLCAMITSAAAQKFTILANLPEASDPLAPLVQGKDGSFYGTTTTAPDGGGIFSVTQEGEVTQLYAFTSIYVGEFPQAGLVQAIDGDFYGATYAGGTNTECGQEGCGTIYRITPQGALTQLLSFDFTDGEKPFSALIQGVDGNYYGMTNEGGNSSCECGTVFRITPDGNLTTVHSFQGSDGASPQGGLVQGTDGNLYGTTQFGGDTNCNPSSGGCGTVFGMTPAGQLTMLYAFDGTKGMNPESGLVEASDGNFYGVAGGGNQTCVLGGCGTIFRITRRGVLTTLFSFDAQNGAYPLGPLIQATDGSLYGTTVEGGGLGGQHCDYGCGTIFRIDARGKLRTLHRFALTDGTGPRSLLQGTNGLFYATTAGGGSDNGGVIFSLDMGLGPFVTFVHAVGKIGQTGGILGQGFTGTTSVLLNGVPASFTVVSDTYIKATVPQGATTGYVTVTTPTGALTSNVPFRVIP
jgi:uncharacterized repeat protein (TIGR03803 family)